MKLHELIEILEKHPNKDDKVEMWPTQHEGVVISVCTDEGEIDLVACEPEYKASSNDYGVGWSIYDRTDEEGHHYTQKFISDSQE